MKKWIALFYRYHRWLGLLVGIPMILWTISGICHPLMANFLSRPLPKAFHPPADVAHESIERSLIQVLRQNDYTTFSGFRLVRLQEHAYYQVHGRDGSLRYFSCLTGEELEDGDTIHAEQLARQFAADEESAVAAIERVERFTGEYGLINRFLPVYRVRLTRPDSVDVYVDIIGERLATHNDSVRRVLLWVFRNFHTWSFLGERENPLRVSIIVLFSLFTLTVAATGVYLFIGMKGGKKGAAKKRNRALQWHRWLGITFSLFLLGFSFSALLVAFPKYRPDSDNRKIVNLQIPVSELEDSLLEVLQQEPNSLHNLSIVEMNDGRYYQVHSRNEQGNSVVHYRNVSDGSLLQDGDLQYARYLFEKISGYPRDSLTEEERVTRFREDYPFIMKRLPVYKMVSSAAPAGSAWYIDTGNGYLAAHKTALGTASGLGFIFLHKFHFLDPLGKNTRDVLLIGVTLLLLLVSVLGIVSWFRRQR